VAIYRTKIIKDVGGFDKNLKYYCEDWDIEVRIRASGWLLAITNAEYFDYERFGITWKTKNNSVFATLQYVFKSAAWYTGFITSHLHRYEPKT